MARVPNNLIYIVV